MTANKENHSVLNRTNSFWRTALFASAAFSLTSPALAQDDAVAATEAAEDDTLVQETVVITGIRAALASALEEKKSASSLIEVIKSEDIGKLPDQNLAEVLENVTGVQITRQAGVGTGVQIRGSNSNRVEINGASTVGAGDGRNGLSFEDVNPAIISSVEIIKASEAKTTEGSVGGTVNLKTIRPLDLSDTLLSVRVQGEHSKLSTEGFSPRISGAYGDRWSTGAGEIGLVVTGSYTEQEAVSFRPRTDLDNLASAPGAAHDEYQGIQFLVQEQENDDYKTLNVASTVEWAPSDELKFSFDAIFNDQERSRDQYRLEASGVSGTKNYPTNAPTTFQAVDYSAIGGPTGFAALSGTLSPDLAQDDDDPNLRFTGETNARVTDTKMFALGSEWTPGNWTIAAEVSTSKSETKSPNLNTTLNFINPNCPLDGAATGDPNTSNDNCVPFIYDLSGDSLAFGIDTSSQYAPTAAQLTDPNNVVLRSLTVDRNSTDNQEDAFRIDASYDFDIDFITSIDAGIRYNKTSHKYNDVGDKIGNFSKLEDSPNGSLFADILVEGPDNFGDADGRSLFISDFLLVDPDLSFNDAELVISTLEDALAAQRLLEPGADGTLTLELETDQLAFRDISEETKAIYSQVNFEHGIFRGNAGLRYIETDVESSGFDSTGTLNTFNGSYDFMLPRMNLVAQPTESVLLRFGYGKDIRRPDFGDLETGINFDTNENSEVEIGNPSLEPEEVTSIDISADWYFAPSAVVSIGYFTKDRTNIFGRDQEGAALITDVNDVNDNGDITDLVREAGPVCSSGIFNPEVQPNQLGDDETQGLCVDFSRPGNDSDTTTQSGWEFAAQYDLSGFEDRLGFASGFGAAVNYTMQEFSGGSSTYETYGRGLTVLGELSVPRGLLDFSENAYNATVFYEKYGLSARARYTWREGFRTEDFGGGASLNSSLSLPVHTLDRGQLNASVNYDITEKFSIGLEATNITEEKIIQKCGTEQGPTCFVGYPDRRITFGGTYTF